MTPAEKDQAIKGYIEATGELLRLTGSLNEKELDFRPRIDGAWTIREHLAHFYHADMFSYTRVGLAVAQPGADLFVWDEQAWNSRIDPKFLKAAELLEAIKSVRASIAALARSVPVESWDAAVANHSKRGLVKLADILAIYSGHADFHLEYVNRNIKAMGTSPHSSRASKGPIKPD